MKKHLLILSFFTTILWAQTDKDILNQLENINKMSDTKANCPTCNQETVSTIYGPKEALDDINSGNLVFLGRAIFPGSDQNSTCAFKNDRAYVLYNNCMSSRKEPPAMDVEVLPYSGGAFKFYVENQKSQAPISSMKRSEYDGSWSISYLPAVVPKDLSFLDLKKFKGTISTANGGCFTGGTMKAQDPTVVGSCFGKESSKVSAWRNSADDFWHNPSEDFYSTHKKLRKLHETTKF